MTDLEKFTNVLGEIGIDFYQAPCLDVFSNKMFTRVTIDQGNLVYVVGDGNFLFDDVGCLTKIVFNSED